ncbi:MAG: hypothetical protein AT714_02020 [Vulcanisaeta sp. OSP_8]|jgi:hypothetical protein|nr:MAG: hypothetical protein AT714_02020 [Vulcanisaeta sp. OSP_8]
MQLLKIIYISIHLHKNTIRKEFKLIKNIVIYMVGSFDNIGVKKRGSLLLKYVSLIALLTISRIYLLRYFMKGTYWMIS